MSLTAGLLIYSCATYKTQYKTPPQTVDTPATDKISHTFYFIGDAGNSPMGERSKALEAFGKELEIAEENSTAVFLGDNIYPIGMRGKDDEGRELSEYRIDIQTQIAKKFKGKTVFIPGNHDWYSDGLIGLKRQEKRIEETLGKNTFLPEDGCPLERKKINDDVDLLLIDSEWFIEDWNQHPGINAECDIKTREQFFEEVESYIKKSQGKILLIAMHHPLLSNGGHGGQFSLDKQLYPVGRKTPLPVVGSLLNFIRKTSGISPQDIQSKPYRMLKDRLFTLAQQADNVVFVSGHEHNLQYAVSRNIPLIVSGSGSKTAPASVKQDGLFSYGGQGYVKLTLTKDGRAVARFYGEKNGFTDPLFETEVRSADTDSLPEGLASDFPETVKASIYNKEEVQKGGLYASLWGKHYREEYGRLIKARTVSLDTLFGGLTPIRAGGGHQTHSLRMENKEGRQYMIREVRKGALRFLQSVAFKDQYVLDDLEDSYTEALVMDFYTTALPYAALTVGELSDAIDVLHANPSLYYVPRQKALGKYNDRYGDALYLIEERVTDGHGNVESFANSDVIISTSDVLKELRRRDKNTIDERLYIRSRLFDMLLGDWDRHDDQWRWAETGKKDGKTLYKPIPRDRDQIFSSFDGPFLGLVTRMIPGVRMMQTYTPKIRSLKWFNFEPFPLDMAILNDHSLKDWQEEAAYISENINEKTVDRAFARLPEEMDRNTLEKIKSVFLERKEYLPQIAEEYYHLLKKHVVVHGTDKDDYFVLTREKGGITKLEAYRIIKGVKKQKFMDLTFNRDETREIWLYGLEDDDVFEVNGEGDDLIPVKIIGGDNNDVYKINNARKIKVYDHRSKPNTFEGRVTKRLSDNYDLNTYDHGKVRRNAGQLFPDFGFNPDDGVKLGLKYTFTGKGLRQDPYTQQHSIKGGYYFATKGFNLAYSGEILNITSNWRLAADAAFTNPLFSINYFGYGNETENPEDELDMDYNRVRMSSFSVSPKLAWKGYMGGYFKIGPVFETVEIEKTEGRFIDEARVNPGVFDWQQFFGAEMSYGYTNFDSNSLPTLGMGFDLTAGYKSNLDNSREFFYITPQIRFTTNIDVRGKVVFATKFKARFNTGDEFEFYQAASIGGIDGLRGFRNQRFTGRTSFYNNNDLRFQLAQFRTGLFPMTLGTYGGFDYGRVWTKDDNSGQWHNAVGGGLYLNAINMFTANVSLFNSTDGNRFVFGLGFNF
ncbi:metallophosphoesterase [Sinomicrobium weinanense]|uniref:Metallophosphoesterase n=1 Tax=Sinomicrobium weinanense TaxID=2842200 RepID=A0A926Q1V3_9FLAO|nr:metallophosphoesterase [Sinomicrobium weinanense]MBU3121951.1 metallophosphoesterase [Sinomicrobium weinanense]